MDKKIDKLYNAGQKDKAIHLLINKIDQDQKNIENYLQLSTYLIEENSVDQALELLKKAQGLVIEPEKLSYNIAICYYMQGEFEKSLNIINTLPNDDETLYQKALIFMKLGQFQKALAYALTKKKQDDRTYELLGDIWLSLGDLKTARQEFEQIPSAKRNAKVNFLLGLTILDHDRDQAQNYFDRSKELDSAYFTQAQSQYAAIAKMLRGKDEPN
ncbi:tetratricopeptide repeat protein [Lactobacillus rodentium]|uniref:Uncharacterized protein n=1 Tax=Lactobacillus rodentium TaxID=947835 RepID=A0A2Z6T6W2_9LACO|nr:tetratricopeptide repeat protein [Lactobacillus rodentium]MCR1894387.1 tetratricopeptide repeat protein [Lactobacillus rodentium]GBG04686.1 hypothetical protein LrDSM24759_06000 [Lactobacillus rodentium]